jgi:TPR repeat protein
MTNIGDMYRTGEGVAQNYQLAMVWYRKGADAGDAGSMNKIGAMYASGLGVTQDYQQAIPWFQKAANAGDTPAMENLGGQYLRGEGVAQDDQQALTWYKKAADAGDAHAMSVVAGFYVLGKGVAKDPAQALFYFHKAAELGDEDAKKSLAQLGLESGPAPVQTPEIDQYKAALQAFLQSLQPFEAELRNIENAKQLGCTLVEYSKHVQILINAYGEIAPSTPDFPKFILRREDGRQLTSDYANQVRELAKSIAQGESLGVQSWNSLIEQQIKGDISKEECSARISKLQTETRTEPLFIADDAARRLLNAPDLARWVVGSTEQRAAAQKLIAQVKVLREDSNWNSSPARDSARAAWMNHFAAQQKINDVANEVQRIESTLQAAKQRPASYDTLREVQELGKQLEATGPQLQKASSDSDAARLNLQRENRAAVIAAGEELAEDESLTTQQREYIRGAMDALRL